MEKLPGMAPNGAGRLFFLLIQTLPTFWADWIWILRIFIFRFFGPHISGFPGPQISRRRRRRTNFQNPAQPLSQRTQGSNTSQGALAATQEMDLAAKEAALQETQTLTADKDARNVKITARHGSEDIEVEVFVPISATFYDVKKAIAKVVGSNEVLEKGSLAKKKKGSFVEVNDSSPIGHVRQVAARAPCDVFDPWAQWDLDLD